MSFTRNTVRSIGIVDGIQRFTGLPLLATETATLAGNMYPQSSVVRQRRIVSFSTPGLNPTWIARPGGTVTGDPIPNILSQTENGFGQAVMSVCAPELVDWSTAIRSGRRPRTSEGGWVVRNIMLPDNAFLDATIPGRPTSEKEQYELRQWIRVGNTFVLARKIAPLIPSADINAVGYNAVWFNQVLNTEFGRDIPVLRYLNGDADDVYGRGSLLITDTDSDPANVATIYAAPVDPGSNHADADAALPVGTIVPPGTVNIYPADLAAAGVVRWEQYFIWADTPGPLSGGATITLDAYVPLDVPPVYNCKAVDGLIFGGYYP